MAKTIPARWWWDSALAGLIGGLGSAFYWMVTAATFGKGFWAPMNAVASMFPAFRPAAAYFNGGPSLTGAGMYLLMTVIGGLVMGWAAAVLYPLQIQSLANATLISLALSLAGGTLITLWFGPPLMSMLNLPHNIFLFIGCTFYMLFTNWVLSAWSHRRDLTVTFLPEVTVAERERIR